MPSPRPHAHRLFRPRPCELHTLRHVNIRVLPSAAGCVLGITLLVLLLASVNFQLNLGYALTFLITGSALSSLWMGYRNLLGVQLRLGHLQPVFQGERATVPVVLQIVSGSHQRHGLSLALHRAHDPIAWVHADLNTQHTTVVALSSVPHQRGWHRVPQVVIESRFPLGVFRLWSYWQPQGRVLVYPSPEAAAPPLHPGHAKATGPATSSQGNAMENFDVRSYQRGDPMHNVAWKKTATALATGSGNLVVREEKARHHTPSLWLQAHDTGLIDTEAQIMRLTAWVLQAHAQQCSWGLQLPSGKQIAPATGTAHLHTCLAALAVDGTSLPLDSSKPLTGLDG